MKIQPNTIKILVLITYILMITVNALANILPINGLGTGQVSDSYQNLFAPAAATFAIWGLIYLLLAAYTLYQLGLFREAGGRARVALNAKVGILFAVSSLANAAWIFAWHYQLILLSMLLMIVILSCLISINGMLAGERLSPREKFFLQIPFSVYFGWITVATIANATTLLVSWGWQGWGVSEPVWAVIIIIVGMLIGAATTISNQDIAYGLVLIWAYTGILNKHLSETGFGGEYLGVIITVIICLLLLLGSIYYVYKMKQPPDEIRFGVDDL